MSKSSNVWVLMWNLGTQNTNLETDVFKKKKKKNGGGDTVRELTLKLILWCEPICVSFMYSYVCSTLLLKDKTPHFPFSAMHTTSAYIRLILNLCKPSVTIPPL